MKRPNPIVFTLIFLLPMMIAQEKPAAIFNWKQLAPIPDQFGFAGSFAGVSNGALIVAGGANFPDGGAPWTGSTKVWSDKIYVLEPANGKWHEAGKLPRPLGYGVSITFENKLICIGGSNSQAHFADVFSLEFKNGKIITTAFPALPKPLANSCGALLGKTIFIAGGLTSPGSTTTEQIFWSLDLSTQNTGKKWRQNKHWPGPARMLAVAGAQNGSFYLFSGASLLTHKNGQPVRKYLKDAYRFTPGKGWQKLADLPHAVVAAPSPAYAGGPSQLFIFGGDDGLLADKASQLKEQHPGFSDRILRYNTHLDKWTNAGKIYTAKSADSASNPNNSIWAPVTTSLVLWNKQLIFPGGEVRPAVRTPHVLMAELNHHHNE